MLVSSCLEFLSKATLDKSYVVSVNIRSLLSNFSFAGFGFIFLET